MLKREQNKNIHKKRLKIQRKFSIPERTMERINGKYCKKQLSTKTIHSNNDKNMIKV